MNEEYYVNGYLFTSADEANKAIDEANRIKAIQSKIDLNNPAAMKALYLKVCGQKVFETQIGLEFMRNIQLQLIDADLINPKDNPLVLASHNTSSTNPVDNVAEIREEYEVQISSMEERFHKKVEGLKTDLSKEKKLNNSKTIICIALVVMVIIMFIITLTSKNPNVLNYKRAVANEYSSWEQDLINREEKIREKESELGIENSDVSRDVIQDEIESE